MKQQVDITLKLSLWLDTAMDEDEIVTHVRSSLPKAFGEELTAMKNPVDILDVKPEAEIYGTEEDGKTVFEFEKMEGQDDRAFVEVDSKYSVVIIRTEEGIIVDVYPKDWDAPIDSMGIHDHDVADAERDGEAA
jgi:hypothetical protein